MYRVLLPAESREANTCKVNNTLTQSPSHTSLGTPRPPLWPSVRNMSDRYGAAMFLAGHGQLLTTWFIPPTWCFCYSSVCFLLGSRALRACAGEKNRLFLSLSLSALVPSPVDFQDCLFAHLSHVHLVNRITMMFHFWCSNLVFFRAPHSTHSL